jgi:hypothetical protein
LALGFFKGEAVITRNDTKEWVLVALSSLGRKAWATDVAKYIWENYETDLRLSGSMLYTWQYDVRWAATTLRKEGKLKPVHGKRGLPWELA